MIFAVIWDSAIAECFGSAPELLSPRPQSSHDSVFLPKDEPIGVVSFVLTS